MAKDCAAWIVPADITLAGDRARIADAVLRLGRLDLLVNNAGVIAVSPVSQTADDDLERMLATAHDLHQQARHAESAGDHARALDLGSHAAGLLNSMRHLLVK